MEVIKGKGCQTCARRKVKCDRTRPFCNNCTKGLRQCSGYGVLKFRDETPRIKRKIQRSGAHQQIASMQSGLVLESGAKSDDKASSISTSMMTKPAAKQIEVLLPPPVLLFSPNLDQSQLLHIFASSMLTTDDALPLMKTHSHWFRYLHTIQGSNLLLDASIRAVSLAQLGFSDRIETFLNESRPYYSKALLLLNKVLQDPHEGLSDTTLSVVVLLSYFEMFDQDVTWLRHASGVETLLKLRGPSAFRSGVGRDIYLSYRHILVGEAFYRRTPCFLDEPEWRALAEENKSYRALQGRDPAVAEVLTVIEDVHLELLRVPAYFADLEQIGGVAFLVQGSSALIKTFTVRTKMHHSALSRVFAILLTTLSRLGHSTKHYYSADQVLGVEHDFAGIYVAVMHTSFWSTMIVLNHVLEVLDPDNFCVYYEQSAEFGLNLIRSVNYFERSKFLGPLSVAYALPVAMTVLGDQTQQVWIRSKMEQLGQRVRYARRPWLLEGDLCP